jgi:NAD(P)-dependent dehydrogenase (short-subunit alcohol dehydrogenase family)
MKTAVVTGANTGIGKEIARGLARKGMRVIMACRDADKAEAARAEIAHDTGNTALEVVRLELSSLEEVRRSVVEISRRADKLDVLVNNAGVSIGDRRLTPDGIEWDLGVNHVGPFLLTSLLLDLMKRSSPSRIVIVASSVHRRARLDFDDPQTEKGWTRFGAYATSKLHNVLFSYELARRLAGTGVTVTCMNPGLVRSELYRSFTTQPLVFRLLLKLIGKSPEKGAQTAVLLAADASVEGVTGVYYDNLKPVRSSPVTYEEAAARRSWEMTERLAGIRA